MTGENNNKYMKLNSTGSFENSYQKHQKKLLDLLASIPMTVQMRDLQYSYLENMENIFRLSNTKK